MQSLNDLLKTIFSGFKINLKSINLNIKNTKADLEKTKTSLENTKASLENQIKKSSNLKMDKNNPTGTGSFSLNRRSGTTIGVCSHAEGKLTTASGQSSHAEGLLATASEFCSHAEGYTTTASNSCSHAEGNSTEASGESSHAEGQQTIASGQYSHAEGQRTIASGKASHVQGKYNIEDSSNVYADIIGNGTSSSKKSNASTVDWSGNAWYAGDVYVGSTSGTNKDEGSKKLATEEYVDNSIIVPAPSSADEGKILRVVSGKATWVSLPSASGVSF